MLKNIFSVLNEVLKSFVDCINVFKCNVNVFSSNVLKIEL